MVNLKVIVSSEIALTLQNRQVCDMTEFHITDPVHGKLTSWRGSVQNEYFSIIFIKGILVVSLVERECKLGECSINYAMTEGLENALKECKDNPEQGSQISSDYANNQSVEDQKNISFTDVMKSLNWNYSTDAKIHSDLFYN